MLTSTNWLSSYLGSKLQFESRCLWEAHLDTLDGSGVASEHRQLCPLPLSLLDLESRSDSVLHLVLCGCSRVPWGLLEVSPEEPPELTHLGLHEAIGDAKVFGSYRLTIDDPQDGEL